MIDFKWHNVQAPGAFNRRVHEIVSHIVAAEYKDAKDLYHRSSDKVKGLFEPIKDHIVPVVMPSKKWFNKSMTTKGEGQWIIPPLPHKSFVDGSERKKTDQYFKPTPVDAGWLPESLDIVGDRKFRTKNSTDKFDKEWYQSWDADSEITRRMRDFASQETYRRMNGYWFFNNGKKTYITGKYYCFLNYTYTDKGARFEYRERDRKWFLFWEYCKWHPYCLGMIIPKPRRVGDTSKALLLMMEEVTRGIGKNVGMQSKDEKSADKAWNTMMAKIWESWPAFWKPTNDGFGTKRLRFKRGTNRAVNSTKSHTQSFMDYGSTDPHHYDSQKLEFFYSDEGGKWNPKKGANVTILQLWDKVKETLGQGAGKVGVALFASTVEEMTQAGGDKYQKLYGNSSVKFVNGTRTTSGLFQIFFPAEESLEGFIDKYGFPVIHPPDEKTYAFLAQKAASQTDIDINLSELKLGAREALKQRKSQAAKGGKEDENQQARKYPQTEEEAFTAATAINPLSGAAAAAARLSHIRTIRSEEGSELYRRGFLEWVGDPFRIGSKLMFREKRKGERGWIYVSRRRGFLHIDNEEDNRVRPTDMGFEQDKFMPWGVNYHAGWDPYDGQLKDEDSGTLSDGAFVVIEKPNPLAVGVAGERDMEKPSAGTGLEQYNWSSGNCSCHYL